MPKKWLKKSELAKAIISAENTPNKLVLAKERNSSEILSFNETFSAYLSAKF